MIRRAILITPLLLTAVAASGAARVVQVHAATACTATGFSRDSINLTAAMIDPAGPVSGDVDATGCNIGIYYGPGTSGTVTMADVHGANYFGIVNNGGNVDITHSSVHDIGETPLNGTQHGVGVYFVFGSASTGTIDHSTFYNYQKGGIVVNGGSADVTQNTVVGQGPVNYIAQNGIQFGFGATGTISHNNVSGNSYTGTQAAASGGILIVGGDCNGGPVTSNVTADHNTLSGNDIGVWITNLDGDCKPVATPTHDTASHNTISNDAINNTSGDGPGAGYQAGITDQGDGDVIDHNAISGAGYTPVPNPPPYLFCIDDTATNHIVESNNSCP